MNRELVLEYMTDLKELRAVYFTHDEDTGAKMVYDIHLIDPTKVKPSNFVMFHILWDHGIESVKIVDDCGHTYINIVDEDNTGIGTLKTLQSIAEFVSMFKLHALNYWDCAGVITAPDKLNEALDIPHRDILEAYKADDPAPMSPYVHLAE